MPDPYVMNGAASLMIATILLGVGALYAFVTVIELVTKRARRK